MELRQLIRKFISEALGGDLSFEDVIARIPISDTIDGENVHHTMTTKEIADMLKIPVAKAYHLLCSFGEARAAKFGYRTKDGTIAIDDVNAPKAQSILWQLYSPLKP